ncbi:S41 family peptidase [Fibrella aquatica]|uniref:S41 family peptidase n=1 Tax=Fibrella aquatica TaxID=3242487 RepID=UPI00351FE4FD
MKNLLTLTLLSFFGTTTLAQTLPGMAAYEYLQNERHRADKIVGETDKPPLDSLKKADKILADALTYYDRPDIQALAKANKYLFARKGDILFDRSVVQLKTGQTEAAVQSLLYDLQGDGAAFYASFIDEQEVFEPIRKHAQLAPLLSKLLADSRVFGSSALKTAYKVNISEDEKVAGLSKLWSEAKYNFVYFNHVPDLDWDKLYLQYLPKVKATTSTAAYYRVLQSFYANLHDGHTNVSPSSTALADSVARRPPIRAILVEDKVLVQDVQHDSLIRSGIRPMLEIVSIDGLPVRDYADRFVRPYVAASSEQNRDVNTYAYDLLKGPKDRPVTLVFRDAGGATFSRTLPRTGYGALKQLPTFQFKILPGNIAYVQVTEFESDKGLQGFKAKFDSIAATNALIIDVRLNGGGNSANGWNILGYLTDKPMKTGSYASRLYSPLRRARGEGVVFEDVEGGNTWKPNGKFLYTKPVVVLTSGRTFSAAEDFAVVFDDMKRGKIIGEPTGGSTGQPLSFDLPGGISARVCAKRDMYPDGTEWNGKGIQPTILVRPKIADLQAGRDTVLEAALSQLRK